MNIGENDLQRKQNAILFIETAREMIEAEGIDQVSVRKIADKAGFHNSTIYLYFEDLDELLMLASIKYFREYSESLEHLSNQAQSPTKNFLAIWDLFNRSIFRKPKVFYNFFFGKRSQNLKEILNLYYDILFPEERHRFSAEIETMYFGNNLKERSLRILRPLIEEETAVTEENLDMINEITISCVKYKLEQKCQDDHLKVDRLVKELQEILIYTCGIPKELL
ncbi:TetR/AcrR family transcriptional regulator [Ohessyouella blattaphilus]|uniref:TetR/AcrR family transcriptional regulator n=1 Tax=Ohessyouella blattaphilus TaxID=2949333 RepID=A0ABT1EFI5_9FIRM|nr:TetR/AcrR family transcriptional regulator [Ohessyouella blattaphilus]MCP1109464.1 TetR/AcrR family transcriptional regulator [Ohessyouella blattaphilus]MCR8562858.1 TetR/AcrR family transcriptional regulator [Ohessyouella blattaphilus]